jgi:ribosomal protein S18 acetylase RimI-like enzyme
MNSDTQIIELSRHGKDVNRFAQVSYGIYRNDPHWVAPLLIDLQKVLDERNPFFQHAEMRLWVACVNGQDVGRIAGIMDRAYNEFQKERVAFFGFFESVPDAHVSLLLFEAVCTWARHRNLSRVLGPLNPSTYEACGLLVDGFQTPPVFLMPYNPHYYAGLVTGADFVKVKDLLAYRIDGRQGPLERFERITARVRQRQPGLRIRVLRKKTLQHDLDKIKEVYNAAWEDIWGFAPMTYAEVDFMASRLKPFFTEGLVLLAELAEEPVGFVIAIPDYNQALQPLKGKLLTPQLFGFLLYLFGLKKPTLGRLMAFGVKRTFRRRGIESALLAELLKQSRLAGYYECEASWVLEDNSRVQRLIELFGGRAYKTYRIFERGL